VPRSRAPSKANRWVTGLGGGLNAAAFACGFTISTIKFPCNDGTSLWPALSIEHANSGYLEERGCTASYPPPFMLTLLPLLGGVSQHS